ncbi:hypothetical protein DMA11_09520 [Marinilabiliaceae bacterium JC017]|nr:hypothetical protein DMA11_09520 [Marinilabiliaceae bacterium JC017]
MTSEIQIHPRPWQGTVLGIFSILGIVLSFIAIVILVIALMAGGAFLDAFISEIDIPVGAISMTALSGVLLLSFIPIVVLQVFIAIGIFKGQKWAVIIAMIFSIMGLMGNLISFTFYGVAVNGFLLYCEIICLQEAYYNRRKIDLV